MEGRKRNKDEIEGINDIIGIMVYWYYDVHYDVTLCSKESRDGMDF